VIRLLSDEFAVFIGTSFVTVMSKIQNWWCCVHLGRFHLFFCNLL